MLRRRRAVNHFLIVGSDLLVQTLGRMGKQVPVLMQVALRITWSINSIAAPTARYTKRRLSWGVPSARGDWPNDPRSARY